MKRVDHQLFSLKLPDFFDVLLQESIVFQAESELISHAHQKHRLKVYLEKNEEFDSSSYAGATLEEKWEDYCLYYFKSEKIEREEGTQDGYRVWKMHAKTDAKFQKDHFKIRYFFATVFLDETYALHFEVMYESDFPWAIEDWVLLTFESLQIKGNISKRDTAYRTHLLEAEKAEIEYQQKRAQQLHEEKELKRTKEYPIEIPADGKDYFKVGDFDFEFIQEETNWQIGSLSKDLHVTFKARTRDVKKALHLEILDDYRDDGIVTLTVPARGIHQNGTPTGSIRFEEEKSNAPLFLNARSEGFDYRLAFNGTVTFKEDWVLLAGEMGKDYHNKSFPIQVAKKFASSSLKWKDYQFTSMEEAETTSSENIRFLALKNPDFTVLPDILFTYENLETFTLSSGANYLENKLPQPLEVQPEIGQLKRLIIIRISGLNIKELPDSIAELIDLEQLSFNSCGLESIPEGILQLPKLKYLWLSRNELKTIPEHIDLPALQNIALDKNKFETLPESLAKQPKLNKIDLKDNPLLTLPKAFNKIKVVELSMEDKLRLLDFEYKGADGKGIVFWDDTMFWSRSDEDLIPEIEAIIKENTLENYGNALIATVKKAIGFSHLEKEDYEKIGNHRFGGMPDLPKNIAYPRFGENWREDKDDYVYEFIGQINCSEIAHLQEYLPRTGMLFFFLETLHNVYGGDNNPSKVIYVDDTKNLASGKRFQFTEDDYSEMIGECYQGFKVSSKKMNSVPSFYASYVNTHLFMGEAQLLKENDKLIDDLYDTFEAPLNEKNPFQYAANAHGFTQHENPELQASLAKKGNPEDWAILLTVTSAGDMQWGDAGDLFFVIHKSDLVKMDFSNVFITMESS